MDSTWLTLGIIFAGVVVVVGGVLALRLHAFLALTLGALVVALLTPRSTIERAQIAQNGFEVVSIERPSGEVHVAGSEKDGLVSGILLTLVADREEMGQIVISGPAGGGDEGEQKLVGGRPRGNWAMPEDLGPEDLIAIDPIVLLDARKAASATIGERVARGFGNTCASIGLVIAMAALIGKCLMDSGAADRVVRSALRLTGETGAPAAFMASGFMLGVPVFFDTVFYLMIPLGKALRVRTGRNYLVYVLTIVCGATMAHSLVPPTPGPLFVAEQLDVSIATMIVAGSIVGLFAAGTGYFYALFAGKIWDLPLRDTGDISIEELTAAAEIDESQLPSLRLSLAPILVPVVLITVDAVWEKLFGGSPRWLSTIGDKNIALTVGAAIALWTLIQQKSRSLKELAPSLQSALASGGVIILITAAGGSFGGVLRETGVAGLIRDLPNTSPAMLCIIAFLITTAIRTAQGSATVAMMTAVGVLSGLAKTDLGFHPVYLALAIGCGSKPIAWMNDSGFWVITKMSGMTEGEGLKYVTPMTALMGVVGLVVVVIGVTLFPMR